MGIPSSPKTVTIDAWGMFYSFHGSISEIQKVAYTIFFLGNLGSASYVERGPRDTLEATKYIFRQVHQS